jgi:tetratricopeptide (TPR) repeat protein
MKKTNLKVAQPKIEIPPELQEADQARINGDYEKALRLGVAVLQDNFDMIPALTICAHVFIDTKRFGLAHALMQRAVQLDPSYGVLWNNLGICYEEQEHLDEAERCFIKALNRNPNDDLALSNLAALYIKKSMPEKALNCATKAFGLNPDIDQIRNNIAQSNLMMGNWKEGWENYDFHLGKPGGRKERMYGPTPRWTGVEGLNLVVHGEQGIGDEISFASCIPDLMRENKVVIECDHRLQGLFRRSFDVPVYGTLYMKGGITWPHEHDLDAKVAIGSLPGFYRNSPESFPGTPYLTADPERRIQWRALLDSMGPKKKVGIAWTGGIAKTGRSHRSMHITDMLPILRQDATFISLQYKPAPELYDLMTDTGIAVHHWPHAMETKDYDDTAALVAELDLVITVQQSVVHLAGGLGVPCWVMVPTEGALWRYGVTGSEFPWAKSVKIYRQHKKQWHDTVAEVATDLRSACAEV